METPIEPMSPVIAEYSLQEATEDGVLVKIFIDAWDRLSGGKPIVMTAAIAEDLTREQLMQTWNEFVFWHRHIQPLVPEKEQMFTTTINERTVWVIEDSAAFTILYPEDY